MVRGREGGESAHWEKGRRDNIYGGGKGEGREAVCVCVGGGVMGEMERGCSWRRERVSRGGAYGVEGRGLSM